MQQGYVTRLYPRICVRSVVLLRAGVLPVHLRTPRRCLQAPRPGVPELRSVISRAVRVEHHSVPKRSVAASARKGKRQKASDGPNSSQAGPADATQLLQALVQLASRATVIVGSHQAHALLNSLEPQLPQQISRAPTSTLTSGLWAMTRLQLQPSEELIAAVAQHLIEPQQAGNHNSSSSSSTSTNKLHSLDTRTLGSLFYSLNFFKLRNPAFWAAAAATAAAQQQHIGVMKPAGLSNLLQGLAGSDWSAAAAPFSPQQASRKGSKAVEAGVMQQQRHQDQQQAVAGLLHAVEQLLLSEPDRLGTWRMRDISQLCQSYALMGWNCTLLFATVANHLLEYSPPPPPPGSAAAHTESHNSSSSGSQAAPSWLQQQQQQWNRSASAADAARNPQYRYAAYPGAAAPQFWGRSPLQSYHYKGRGPGRLSECRASDIAGLAWAFVATWCTNQLLLQELAAVMTAKAVELHAADCSRLLWAYATAGVVDRPMLTAVTAAVAEEMSTVLPRTAAGCVWSLAVMGFEAPAFMEAALDRLAACLEATPVALASTAAASRQTPTAPTAPAPQWSNAAAISASGGGVEAAAAKAGPTPQAAAASGPSVLQQLYSHPPAALLSGGPEGGPGTGPNAGELSMLSMVHRRRNRNRNNQQQQQPVQQDAYDPAQIFQLQHPEPVGDHVDCSRDHSQQQHQPSVGTYWRWQEQQPSGTADSAEADVSVQCSAQDVAQAMYACGRLQHYNAAFCSVLRVRFQGLLPGFTDSELVEVLWGLARLNLYDEDNMEAAAAELIPRVRNFPGSLLGLTAWSYASLKHTHPELFKAIARRACELQEKLQLKPLDANQLVRAAAKLCFRDDKMFEACAVVLHSALPRLGDSMLVSSLWGFAVAGFFDGPLCEAGFRRVSQLPATKARPLLLLQLFQAATLTQDAYSVAGLTSPVHLPSALLLASTRQWMYSNRRSPRSSKSNFQTAVVQVLSDELGLHVEEEVLTEDGLFSIDAAVTWNTRRLAVEVDGPTHFTNNMPYQLLGSSVAKQRCLQARGWVVLSVPYFTWNSLAGSNNPHVQQQQQQANRKVHRSTDDSRTSESGVPLVCDGTVNLSARGRYLMQELERAVSVSGLPVGLQQNNGVLSGIQHM